MASLEVPDGSGAAAVRVRASDRYSLPVVRSIIKRPRLTEAVFGRTRWGNIFADGMAANPYLAYEPIVADGPVVWSSWFQQWFVTGYDEARDVLSSPAVEVSTQREVVLAVKPHSAMSENSKELFRHFLLFVDPPDHTRLRALVSRAFTPRQMARIEPEVERIAEGLLDRVADDPRPDLFAAYNAPLPIHVISALLGIPEQRWPFTVELSKALITYLDPFPDFDPAEVDAMLNRGVQFFDDLIEDRRSAPQDDLISALVAAENDDDRLTRFETIAMAMFLMFAGHETTSGSLGNSMVALARFPEQRALIRDNPELWPNAVEELLRWDAPLQVDPRAAREDLEVGGQTIKAGKRIAVMLGAANRDRRRWPDADELRLDREDPRPISFGHGIHHCIGAALARMQMRIGLRVFLDRFGDYDVDSDAVVWKEHAVLRGPVELPIIRPSA
ncbi:MAG: cytochrome P450 [Acidimicrobiales bacterium]